MCCLSFWSVSRPTFHPARGRVPPLWRSSLWSKPSCKSMCTVSRTASVLHNQHFKAALSIIRALSAFAHAFHFSGPCWVKTETVCSWHHLSLRGFLELSDLPGRDFFFFFLGSISTRNCSRSWFNISSFICGASSRRLVKNSAVTLKYYLDTFLSNGPSFQPCSTPLIKTPRASAVMPLSSFGDKDEPLGNFQLITTHFSGHRWSYSRRNCIGSIIQLVSAFRMSAIPLLDTPVVWMPGEESLLVCYLYCTLCALQSNAALWLIYLKYASNMDTFVTEPFTVPQSWSDMWEQIPLCRDIKTVDHCSVQARDADTTRPNLLICKQWLFKSQRSNWELWISRWSQTFGIVFFFLFKSTTKKWLFLIKDH